MANLTDADKVLRNDVGKSIASKLDDIADAILFAWYGGEEGGGAHSLGQLSDVDIDTQTLAEGQSIVYNETTQKFENGEVSTVAALDDLTDVSITSAQQGDSLRNDGNGNWVNEPTTIKMTSAEWEAIADKQAWRNAHKNTYLVITDAPNLNATAQDISYDGGAVTVKQAIGGTATIPFTGASGLSTNNCQIFRTGVWLVICIEIVLSSDQSGWYDILTTDNDITLPVGVSLFGVVCTDSESIMPKYCQAYQNGTKMTVRIRNGKAGGQYRGQIIVPLASI